ncbi:MAG: HAMP domain-containing sensor histidine kinase [Elusimicrobiota bacterium]
MRADIPAKEDAPILKVAAWDSPLVLMHHLRNSVGSVSQIIDIISKKEDPEARRAMVSLIQDCVKSSMDLMEEYGQLLQPLETKREPLALAAWLIGLIDNHPIAGAAGVTVNRPAAAGDLPLIRADERQLGRAIHAVLDNALEALEGGGTLSVSLRKDTRRGQLRLIFQDSGPGMEGYILEHVLEPFYSMKKGHKGVGLSWAQKIARAHGGELEVVSAPGQGSSVTMTLPLPSRGKTK